MYAQSYREYLDEIEKPSPQKNVLKQAVLGIVIFSGICFALFSAYRYVEYKNDLPKKAKMLYVQSTKAGISTVNQSLEEIISSFKVAGVNLEKSEENASTQATYQSTYYKTLTEVVRNLTKIESAKKNITFVENDIKKMQAPKGTDSINSEVLAYLKDSYGLLDELENEQKVSKDFLLAAGPELYFVQIADDSLWQRKNKDEIRTYYENKITEVQMAKLKFVQFSNKNESVASAQIAYLELLENMSKNIVAVLSEREKLQPDAVPQVEAAYQVLNDGQKQNVEIAKTIAAEKLKLAKVEDNLPAFYPLLARADNLEIKLNELERQDDSSKLEHLIDAINRFIGRTI